MHLFDWRVKFFFNFFSMRKSLAVKDLRAGGARNPLALIYLHELDAKQKEGARQPLRAPPTTTMNFIQF
jgi:hypothetical protein